LCSRSQEDTPSERLVARHATNCESGPSTRITPWLNSSGLMQKKNAKRTMASGASLQLSSYGSPRSINSDICWVCSAD
jgi:hypothetical protein